MREVETRPESTWPDRQMIERRVSPANIGNAMPNFYVTEVPRRHAKTPLQSNDLRLALDFLERHVGPPSIRSVLWWHGVPPTAGPDVSVAVPLASYREVEAAADRILEA